MGLKGKLSVRNVYFPSKLIYTTLTDKQTSTRNCQWLLIFIQRQHLSYLLWILQVGLLLANYAEVPPAFFLQRRKMVCATHAIAVTVSIKLWVE